MGKKDNKPEKRDGKPEKNDQKHTRVFYANKSEIKDEVAPARAKDPQHAKKSFEGNILLLRLVTFTGLVYSPQNLELKVTLPVWYLSTMKGGNTHFQFSTVLQQNSHNMQLVKVLL